MGAINEVIWIVHPSYISYMKGFDVMQVVLEIGELIVL